MPKLFRWNLKLRRGLPVAVGIVSGHPKMPEGIRIHTSAILRTARVENCLQLGTASGSSYQLPMKEWGSCPEKDELLIPELLNLPADFWTRCAQLRDEARRKEKSDLRSLIEPGTLSLRVVGTHILSALWAGADSQIRVASVRIHLGMFQDSYLILGEYGKSPTLCGVDLRLFPMWNRLEPYHISQEIKLLRVCNEGRTDIAFGFDTKSILCPPERSLPFRFRV